MNAARARSKACLVSPDPTWLDVEAGDVLIAFRKQCEVASVRQFPPGRKGGTTACASVRD
jgi:hypothetical protein